MKRFVARALPHFTRLWPLALLLALFFTTGYRGRNFGEHWDEVGWQILPVRGMVETGMFMPHAAMYPAFARWLVLLGPVLRGLARLTEVGLEPRPIQAAMLAAMDAKGFLLETRVVFLAVSSLAIAWTYLAALALGRPRWEAIVAGAALGLSWEYAYHSRYVATDCIDVQFSALTLLLTCVFVRRKRLGWLYAAAVAAGLGIGTKFSAGPLLFPVVVAGGWALPLWRVRAQLERMLALGGVAFVAFAVSTPAVVFDPFSFVEQLRFISTYYSRGHYGFGVEPGFEHWYKVLLYLALSYFSPYKALSLAAFAFVLLGGGVWLKRERQVGVLLVGFPLVFLIAVCNRFAVLMVRNYLMVAPFCGLMLARGLASAFELLKTVWLRRAAALALGLAGLANAVFLIRAGESIANKNLEHDMRDAIADVERRTGERFWVSPALTAFARRHKLALGKNVTSQRAEHVVFVERQEGPDALTWPANDPFAFEEVFGPLEVNLNWYPTWAGADHVVMASLAKAREMGVPFVQRTR